MSADRTNRGTSRTTQAALVVLIVFIWAVFGLMAGVTVTAHKSGTTLRVLVEGASSPRTLSFIVLFPLGAYGFFRLGRWCAVRRGWDDRTRWLATATAWFGLGVLMAVTIWGYAAFGLLQFAWGGLIPLGCGFLGMGMQRRVGSEPHCVGCGYPYSGEVGPQCPECGRLWSGKDGTAAGRPERSTKLVVTGVVLLLAALTLTLTPLAGGTFRRVAPTAYLIERVEAGDWSGAWAELMARSLTLEQETTLVRGLLDRRVEVGRLDRQASVWLEAAATGGEVPEELRTRYFEEMVELRLRERRRQDGSVEVEVYAENRSLPFGALEPRVIFGGFAIDGEPVAASRIERYASVYRFDPWAVARKPDESLPSVVVAPRTAGGPVVVTAEAWVLYGSASQLSWGEAWIGASTPAIPGELEWVERFSLSVELRPGG